MKPWIPLTAALVVAVPAHFAGRTLSGAEGRAALPSEAANEPTAEVTATLRSLTAQQARLATRLETVAARPAPASAPTPTTDDIATAVDDWLAARGLSLASLEAGDAEESEPDSEFSRRVAELSIDELLSVLLERGFGDDADRIYEELRQSGRMEEYLAALEARVEADPDDPALRVALGMGYLQELFGLGATPEAGAVAMEADRAFGAALELDDTHWTARFLKAVSLSNWPSFLGRTEEAIDHFEVLTRQQEGLPAQEGYGDTWLYLGNMYEQTGRGDEALEAWRKGLERFPDHAELRERLRLAESSGN